MRLENGFYGWRFTYGATIEMLMVKFKVGDGRLVIAIHSGS